jgi:DNA-binding NtrC family response regulator
MGKFIDLKPEERDYFNQIVQAIFLNPFSDSRDELLSSISDVVLWGKLERTTHLLAAEPGLNHRLAEIEKNGRVQICDFHERDRRVMRYIFLLQIYLRYVQTLDELIDLQAQKGSHPVTVPFAARMLDELLARGFSEESSTHYLSLFYQLRRAFYFIDRSLIGQSPSIRKLRESLWSNVFTADVGMYDKILVNSMEDFSTLLLGETGSGKGQAASAIGRSAYIPFDRRKGMFSQNFNETFVSINLSQFPEGLIESELFGHKKGSFTGAVEDHKGLFETCSVHGALFLDEIGEVSIPIQIKLLQVLQERTFSPVGSHQKKRFSGRVIAATNRPLIEIRSQGNFRNDFFYRLCSDIIIVPSLRQRLEERPEELETLVEVLLFRMLQGRETSEIKGIILEAFKRDLPPEYPWPGNVRELEQAIRSVILTRTYKGYRIPGEIRTKNRLFDLLDKGPLEAGELLSEYCYYLYQRMGTYMEVAKATKLDRRTVKKYIDQKIKSLEE